MKLKEILLGIGIVLLIIIILFLYQLVRLNNMQVLYENHYFNLQNLNHEERAKHCEVGLTYIKGIQTSEDIITCCEINIFNGFKHIGECESYIK